VLRIHPVHHVRSARKGVILGTSDDPVDPALRPQFAAQTRSLVRLVEDLIRTSGASAAAYTSSMLRQRQTCEMLFGDTSIPIVVDERLRQIDNGPHYTGMPFETGSRDYLRYVDEPFPGGESFADFARRTREFLDDVLAEHGDHVVLTVGWRLSPAILEHVCRGTSLATAIAGNAAITGPFTYG
jgi:broad specificity phosphatase PhoE